MDHIFFVPAREAMTKEEFERAFLRPIADRWAEAAEQAHEEAWLLAHPRLLRRLLAQPEA